MIELTIDFGNNSSWWDKGGMELWDEIAPNEEDTVELDPKDFNTWIAKARKIEGWGGGPKHAPHPLLIIKEDVIDPLIEAAKRLHEINILNIR